MRVVYFALLTLGIAPAAITAQTGGTAPARPAAPGITAVSSLKTIYDRVKDYVTRSAEQMPESNYPFKPVPEVRSFGGIIGHLVNENYGSCAISTGRTNPNVRDFEKVTSKEELVTAIKASYAFCDAVFTRPDASFMEETEIFGMKMSRMSVAIMTTTHNYEHYGNLITYFRLKGMVPPSSQGGM